MSVERPELDHRFTQKIKDWLNPPVDPVGFQAAGLAFLAYVEARLSNSRFGDEEELTSPRFHKHMRMDIKRHGKLVEASMCNFNGIPEQPYYGEVQVNNGRVEKIIYEEGQGFFGRNRPRVENTRGAMKGVTKMLATFADYKPRGEE